MNRTPRSRTAPRTGGRILLISTAIALIGLLPLLLYLLLAPARGDPAGLILLAVGAGLVALASGGLGSLRTLLRRLLGRDD